MDWDRLLSPVRVRTLMGGSDRGSQPEGDPRTQFERDYGRSVFSSSVRRLQDKAQVFPLEPNDAVRTRLTHSMEVSTLAESVSYRVARRLLELGRISEPQARSIVVIARTGGLLHDIGNPPFGHAGEEAMQGWYRDFLERAPRDIQVWTEQMLADFTSFEGNAQTFRLLTHLQMLNDRHGLNLTCGTLSAACKYIAASDKTNSANQASKKPGFFTSESAHIEAIRQETGTGDARNPITFLIEAADDMVYSTVDLEDGLKKGALTWRELREELISMTDGLPSIVKLLDRCEQYVGSGEFALSGRAEDEARVQIFRTFALYDHVEAVAEEFEAAYESIMKGEYQHELISRGATSVLVAACKALAAKKVYPFSEILRLEVLGREVICGLMSLFWEGTSEAPNANGKWRKSFAGKLYGLISPNYRTMFEREVSDTSGLPIDYWRLRLVGDYVAGMTDTYATSLYRQLTARG